MIKQTFFETCRRYEQMLKNYYPAFNSNGFPERNLTFNFCSSFLKIWMKASDKEDLIIWQEAPFIHGENQDKKKHFDSLIIDDQNNELYLIEAKRLRSKGKKMSIESDLNRLRSEWKNIKFDREERKKYKKYILILTDFWLPYGKRKSKVKNDLINWFENQLGGQEYFDKDKKEILNVIRSTRNEKYYLLYKAWEIRDNEV
jgi:hypothetical protein